MENRAEGSATRIIDFAPHLSFNRLIQSILKLEHGLGASGAWSSTDEESMLGTESATQAPAGPLVLALRNTLLHCLAYTSSFIHLPPVCSALTHNLLVLCTIHPCTVPALNPWQLCEQRSLLLAENLPICCRACPSCRAVSRRPAHSRVCGCSARCHRVPRAQLGVSAQGLHPRHALHGCWPGQPGPAQGASSLHVAPAMVKHAVPAFVC